MEETKNFLGRRTDRIDFLYFVERVFRETFEGLDFVVGEETVAQFFTLIIITNTNNIN